MGSSALRLRPFPLVPFSETLFFGESTAASNLGDKDLAEDLGEGILSVTECLRGDSLGVCAFGEGVFGGEGVLLGEPCDFGEELFGGLLDLGEGVLGACTFFGDGGLDRFFGDGGLFAEADDLPGVLLDFDEDAGEDFEADFGDFA